MNPKAIPCPNLFGASKADVLAYIETLGAHCGVAVPGDVRTADVVALRSYAKALRDVAQSDSVDAVRAMMARIGQTQAQRGAGILPAARSGSETLPPLGPAPAPVPAAVVAAPVNASPEALRAARDLIDAMLAGQTAPASAAAVVDSDVLAHACIADAIDLLETHPQRLLYLQGPPGSGKTTLAESIAARLARQLRLRLYDTFGFVAISVAGGVTDAHLIGRPLLREPDWLDGVVTRAIVRPGVLLIDEIDRGNPAELVATNMLLAQGVLSAPLRVAPGDPEPTMIRRVAQSYIVVAGNSWGMGEVADLAASPMDAAFLSRFDCARLSVDYDRDLERRVAPTVCERMWTLRDAAKSAGIHPSPYSVSTRLCVGAEALARRGWTWERIAAQATIHWAPDHRTVVESALRDSARATRGGAR